MMPKKGMPALTLPGFHAHASDVGHDLAVRLPGGSQTALRRVCQQRVGPINRSAVELGKVTHRLSKKPAAGSIVSPDRVCCLEGHALVKVYAAPTG